MYRIYSEAKKIYLYIIQTNYKEHNLLMITW